MKTVGLIGGMTWHTTLTYYKKLNEMVEERLGPGHSLKCLMYTFDFEEIKSMQDRKQWAKLSKEIIYQGQQLRNAGADCIVLCSNTIHKVAVPLRENLNVPLIHIIEGVGEAMVDKHVMKVLLLGTRYTMLDDFYQHVLKRYGVEVVVPSLSWVNKVDRIIFDELAQGKVSEDSKMTLIGLIESYALTGTNGVILGCTELSMILSDEDVSVHVFDSMAIHMEKIMAYIMK